MIWILLGLLIFAGDDHDHSDLIATALITVGILLIILEVILP